MEAHQKRVIEEKEDLCEKLEKLTEFQKTPLFSQLPVDEQRRLERQTQIMQMYRDVLSERIEAFGLKSEVESDSPSE